MATMTADAADEEKVISLPHLQNLIKRDPEAYDAEFLRQYEHFSSTLEIFQMKPQKPNKHFHELVMFLAHVTPHYPKHHKDYPERLINVLKEFHGVLHSATRKTLVQSLVLLRNRNQFPLVKVLPMYFKLFKCPDKLLRKSLLTHVVKDIERTWQQSTSPAVHGDLQTFFYTQLKGSDFETIKKAIAILICLCQKKIWSGERTVNQISSCLLCPDIKVAAGAAHFFLGNKVAVQKEVMSDSSDGEDEEEANKIIKSKLFGAKKTKGREKKLKRAKKISKRLLSRKEGDRNAMDGMANFAAIDQLHDPHALVEKLLGRVSKSGEPFNLRLLLMQLIARIINRHHMIILNFYPLLQKYLHPNQKNVTQILACLAQATHEMVPPEELQKVASHVINTFINESLSSEVIAVGMNCIREICYRSPFVLTEDQLTDLVQFKKYKDKSVMMATKALINVYREKNPEMLNRSLRGKEAQTAISRGENLQPIFGKTEDSFEAGVDGLDILVAAKKMRNKKFNEDLEDEDYEDVVIEHAANSDDEDDLELGTSIDMSDDEPPAKRQKLEAEEIESEAESEEEGSEEEVESDAEEGESAEENAEEGSEEGEEGEPEEQKGLQDDEKQQRLQDAQSLLTSQVLSTDDFNKIRKLKLKRSLEAQLGRKRTRDEAFIYDSGSEGSDEEADEADDDIITADRLKTFVSTKKKGKEARMQSIMKGREGREDIKEKRESKKKRKGGKTNRENARNKPMQMVQVKKRRKKNEADDRICNLKRTIKNLGTRKCFTGKVENRGGKKGGKKNKKGQLKRR